MFYIEYNMVKCLFKLFDEDAIELKIDSYDMVGTINRRIRQLNYKTDKVRLFIIFNNYDKNDINRIEIYYKEKPYYKQIKVKYKNKNISQISISRIFGDYEKYIIKNDKIYSVYRCTHVSTKPYIIEYYDYEDRNIKKYYFDKNGKRIGSPEIEKIV